MKFTKGELVVVMVPPGKRPYHGWQGNGKAYDIGLVISSSSTSTGLYFSMEYGGTFLGTELKRITHPFVATFTALGRGVATAVLDAGSVEEAAQIAQRMIEDPTATDFTSRTTYELTWQAKSKEDVQPVLISIEDRLPYWEDLIQKVWKGKDPR